MSKRAWLVKGYGIHHEHSPLNAEQTEFVKRKMQERYDVQEWCNHRERCIELSNNPKPNAEALPIYRAASAFFEKCAKEAQRILRKELGLSKNVAKRVYVHGHPWSYHG